MCFLKNKYYSQKKSSLLPHLCILFLGLDITAICFSGYTQWLLVVISILDLKLPFYPPGLMWISSIADTETHVLLMLKQIPKSWWFHQCLHLDFSFKWWARIGTRRNEIWVKVLSWHAAYPDSTPATSWLPQHCQRWSMSSKSWPPACMTPKSKISKQKVTNIR